MALGTMLASGLLLRPSVADCLSDDWTVTVTLRQNVDAVEAGSVGRRLARREVRFGSIDGFHRDFEVDDVARAELVALRTRLRRSAQVLRATESLETECR